jgi:hypothetical protein
MAQGSGGDDGEDGTRYEFRYPAQGIEPGTAFFFFFCIYMCV